MPAVSKMQAAINGGAPPGPWCAPMRALRRYDLYLAGGEGDFFTTAGATYRRSSVAFVWPHLEAPLATMEENPVASIVASATAAALSLGYMVTVPAGVTLACLPMFPPPPPLGLAANAAPAEGLETSSRACMLQQALVWACISQASAALLEFALNDPLSGLIGCGISALGMQAASPQGYRFLPSYIVLAFCNGTMQVLLGIELASARHALGLVAQHTLWSKLAVVVSLVSPGLMFGGLAIAWHLHCELRSMALRAPPRLGGAAAGTQGAQGAEGETGASSSGGAARGSSEAGPTPASGSFRAFSGVPHRLGDSPPKS